MLTVEALDVFHGDAQALDGVSLEVAECAIVAIVGVLTAAISVGVMSAKKSADLKLSKTACNTIRERLAFRGAIRSSTAWLLCRHARFQLLEPVLHEDHLCGADRGTLLLLDH